MDGLGGASFARLPFEFEQEIREPPDFPHVGILGSAQQQGFVIAWGHLRSTFVGRGSQRTCPFGKGA